MMDFLMKNKKSYLMVGGTLFPAMSGYLIAKSLGVGESTKALLVISGLILGGIVTAKMLK